MKQFYSLSGMTMTAFLVVVSFLTTGHALAQPGSDTVPQQRSLLWKIEGKDLHQPSYLFGTVHMICQEKFRMSDKVQEAINQTQQSYLEINLGDPNMAQEAQKHMMSTQAISQQVTAEEARFIDSTLKAKIGIGLERLDNVKPMILIASILQKDFPCNVVSFESEIIKRTEEKSHPIYGLSSVEEQYSFLEKIMQTKDFATYLRELENFHLNDLFQQLYAAYEQEDLNAIMDIMSALSSTNPEAYHQLLNVRNHLWADRIPAIVAQEPTFIAVGSAHLMGEEGLITLLRNKGYQVTPVL